jgi:hypothetical protein
MKILRLEVEGFHSLKHVVEERIRHPYGHHLQNLMSHQIVSHYDT